MAKKNELIMNKKKISDEEFAKLSSKEKGAIYADEMIAALNRHVPEPLPPHLKPTSMAELEAGGRKDQQDGAEKGGKAKKKKEGGK